jgi:hypothetical protein
MEPVTRGGREDAAAEHARRVVARIGLSKLFAQYKEEFELTDRLDKIADAFVGVIFFVATVAFAWFSISYFSTEAIKSFGNPGVFARYISFALASAAIAFALFGVTVYLLRLHVSRHPTWFFYYGVVFFFAFVMFGLVGVIPIALLAS